MSGDPRARFSGRVDAYVRHRPRYPEGLLPLLRERIGLARTWIVADVGAGPGLSSEPFLEHGNPVIAVEPNEEMRAAAEARLGGRRRFRCVAGRAEETGLPPGSVDLVLAAQALHWFAPRAARREFGRILRPPGHVVIVWNTRRTEGTAFLEAYEALLLRHGTDYQTVRHDRRRGVIDALFPEGYERHALPLAQRLDREGLRGRLVSSSYTPAADDPGRGPMLEEADRIFEAHARAGRVELAYETEVYLGRVPVAALGGAARGPESPQEAE